MPDLLDEYTTAFLDYMEDEIAQRRADAARPKPCTFPKCHMTAYKLKKDGTNTRFCRHHWETEFDEGNLPEALVVDFALNTP